MALSNLWIPDSKIQRPESLCSAYVNFRRRQATVDYSDSLASNLVGYFLHHGEAGYNIVVGKGNAIDRDNEFFAGGDKTIPEINGGMYGRVTGASISNRKGFYPVVSSLPITIMVCGYLASSTDTLYAEFKANAATDPFAHFALKSSSAGTYLAFYDITNDITVSVGSADAPSIGTNICVVASIIDNLHAVVASNGVLLQDYTSTGDITFVDPIDLVFSQYSYKDGVPFAGAQYANSIHNREFSIEEAVAYSLSPYRFIYEG